MNIDRSVFSDPSAYFTPADSLVQLNRLRAAVFDGAADQGSPDAFLLVGGVDGRDDPWNAALIQHLFCGCSQAGTATTQTLWDAVILLTPTSSQLYCSPQGLPFLQMMTAAWPNHQTHSPNPKVWDDENELEDNKIMALRLMVSNCERVAMVCLPQSQGGAKTKPGTADITIVEKWPLIQSYAIDAQGRRPFFSLAKQVVDATAKVAAAMTGGKHDTLPLRLEREVDSQGKPSSHQVKSVALSSMTTLKTQWDAFTVHAAQHVKKGNQDPLELVDPLTLYQRFTNQRYGMTSPAPELKFVKQEGVAPFTTIKFQDPCLGSLSIARSYTLTAAVESAEMRKFTASYAALVDAFTTTSDPASAFLSASHVKISSQVLGLGGFVTYVQAVDETTGAIYGDTFLSVDDAVTKFNVTQSIPPFIFFQTEGKLMEETRDFAEFVEAQMDVPPSKRGEAQVLGGKKAKLSVLATGLGRVEDVCNASDGVVCHVWPNFNQANGSKSIPLSLPQAKVAVCAEGFVIQQQYVGTLGPFHLASDKSSGFSLAALANPPDTSTPIVFRFTAKETPNFVVDICFQPSSSARRDLVSTWLAQWKEKEVYVARRQEVELPTEAAEKLVLSSMENARVYTAGFAGKDRAGEGKERRARATAAVGALKFFHGAQFLTTANGLLVPAVATSPGAQGKANAAKKVHVVIFSGPVCAQKHKLLDGAKRAMEAEAAAQRGQGKTLSVGALLPEPYDEKLSELSNDFVQKIRSLGSELAAKSENSFLFVYCPAYVALARLYHSIEEVGGLEEKSSGVAWSIVGSVVVVSADTFYSSTTARVESALKASKATFPTDADAVSYLPVAPLVRQCLAPGFYNLLVLHQPVANRTTRLGAITAAAGGGGVDPALLGSVEGDIADTSRGFTGTSTTQPKTVYSFQDALQALVAMAQATLDGVAATTLPALSSSVAKEQRSMIPRQVWLNGRSFQPVRHVVIHFAKMFITDPSLNDFFNFASRTKPAMDTANPWYAVTFLKGLLNVGGRAVEITCTAGNSSLNKYQEKKTPGGSVVRHSQEFHLVLDSQRLKENMWARKCENDESEIMKALQLAIEGELSADTSILDSLIASAKQQSSATAGGAKAVTITSESLTTGDIAKIADLAAQQNIPLPVGWKLAADGVHYTKEDDSSVQSQFRPDIQELVNDYLAELTGDTSRPFSTRGPDDQKEVKQEFVVDDEADYVE